MGMEVNGVVAASSYQSQNSQAAKPVSQVSSVTSATDKSNEVVVDSAKSVASNVAVSVGQAADSEKNGSNANDNDKAKKQAEVLEDGIASRDKEIFDLKHSLIDMQRQLDDLKKK